MSLQTGFLSEYTGMTILENDFLKKVNESDGTKEVCIRSFEVLFPKKLDIIIIIIKQCYILKKITNCTNACSGIVVLENF